ncbi:MAG: HIT family protein [Sporolactobacillus sp.]
MTEKEGMIEVAEDNDCIFCKIINGDIPSAKVYEDEDVYAFLDIGQVTKGHTLVIPKKHIENIFELDADTAAKLYRVVPSIARALKETFHPVGLNVLNSNGKLAGQSVFHYHIHLIPRYGADDTFTFTFTPHVEDYSADQRAALADSIIAHLN